MKHDYFICTADILNIELTHKIKTEFRVKDPTVSVRAWTFNHPKIFFSAAKQLKNKMLTFLIFYISKSSIAMLSFFINELICDKNCAIYKLMYPSNFLHGISSKIVSVGRKIYFHDNDDDVQEFIISELKNNTLYACYVMQKLVEDLVCRA